MDLHKTARAARQWQEILKYVKTVEYMEHSATANREAPELS